MPQLDHHDTCLIETRSPTTMKTPTALLAGLALGFTVLIERLALAFKVPQAT